MLGHHIPRSRHPPRADTPQEQTPPRAGPLEQTPPREQTPPGADTPSGADTPQSRHPSPRQTPPGVDTPLQDKVNELLVRILLECNLVFNGICRKGAIYIGQMLKRKQKETQQTE